MSKWSRTRQPPAGYEYIEPVMDALASELREKMNEPHEGKRQCESLWPIHQISWQRSRYVYDMFYIYKRISREVYDYCIKMKLVDANLIAKWKKPGYERLCSTYAINSKNYNYGTVNICRVPRHQLSEDQVIQEKHSGCRGCASGPGGYSNIFGNKYGQYLARIQIAREVQAANESEKKDVWATPEEDVGEEKVTKRKWSQRGLNDSEDTKTRKRACANDDQTIEMQKEERDESDIDEIGNPVESSADKTTSKTDEEQS
uniref:Uncharacterized protein AlNc14C153G7564 n=1 Tax=Albugo laibachii Nc14 TaxID=890382 RepID=F0WM61_9STRA|nr:conserved hypothetical protein [Albugo laibachii Nc14]|eukprot:CCA22389.1 conserved hypothetical protein [Albugo laibachii Nc14]